MVDIKTVFSKVNQKFGWLARYVDSAYYTQLPSSLQEEIASIITDLVVKFMRPTLASYILTPIRLKDGTILQGQSAFDRLVKENKDVLALIQKYRPSYLFYLDKAKKIRQYIRWSNEQFVSELEAFLRENGIYVNNEAREYLFNTVERFRRYIYG